MKLVLGNDVGNDKMKIIEAGIGQVVKVPSAYKYLDLAPTVHENDLKKNVINLIDNLVVHITSKSIRFQGLYAIGAKAIQSTGNVRNMDISVENKHTSDLPLINTLGYCAARAVQKEFEKRGKLPTDLSVEIYMSTAIPASQHNIDSAEHLENRFEEGIHTVIVYVGKELVTVKLQFQKVKVMKEGVPALYSIFEGPKEMFKEFGKEYNLENVKGTDFVESRNMHVDIGSGTTEYVYTVGVNPIPDLCSGERRGVGHAIESALQLMKAQRAGFNINRQQFDKFIERPDEYKDSALAIECLEKARVNQVIAIQGDIENKYSTILANEPELLTIYGGGSIEFKPDMYDVLKQFGDSVNAKILWIPKEYAVDMNVRGLDILNKNLLFETEYRLYRG